MSYRNSAIDYHETNKPQMIASMHVVPHTLIQSLNQLHSIYPQVADRIHQQWTLSVLQWENIFIKILHKTCVHLCIVCIIAQLHSMQCTQDTKHTRINESNQWKFKLFEYFEKWDHLPQLVSKNFIIFIMIFFRTALLKALLDCVQ